MCCDILHKNTPWLPSGITAGTGDGRKTIQQGQQLRWKYDTDTVWPHIRGCSRWMSWNTGRLDQTINAHAVLTVWISVFICTHGHTKTLDLARMLTGTHIKLSCSRTQSTPPRITETRLNPSNPSIATSVITQSINLGPRSIWQASTWGERQSLSTCRYMILTGWR